MEHASGSTEAGGDVDAAAVMPRDSCGAAGPCGGGAAQSTDRVLEGVEAPSIGRVLEGLEAAQRLVAMASQLPLAGGDDDLLAQVIAEGGRLRSGVEALLLSATAAMEANRAGSGRAALRDEARMSARAAAQKANVSRQLAEMPNVVHGLANGALTVEHAEVLADAARRSRPDVVDAMSGLLETARKASPDVLRREAREMLAQHDPAAAEGQLGRQRRERSAALFTDEETGMGVLNARFDPVSFALVKQAVENYNDALWRLDGGRDGTPGAVRDNRQRLADSVFEMLTDRSALAVGQQLGSASAVSTPGLPVASGSGAPAASESGLSAVPGPGLPAGGEGGECRSVPTWSPALAPNQLVIVADIGVVDGTMPEGRCEVLGAGPVPASILDHLSPDTRIAGALFSGQGQALWLGRSRRHATAAQQLVVAVRDRGCVLCGSPMHRCEYHHIDEWNADGGKTDVENIAALCNGCHDSLHKAGRRLCRDPATGHWGTRKRTDASSTSSPPTSGGANAANPPTTGPPTAGLPTTGTPTSGPPTTGRGPP